MLTLLYRNFRLLILCLVLIVLWGFTSFQQLPRLEDPELTPRAAIIQTFFPGASADRVEALVTEKIEAEIATIPELLTYQSTSRAGISTVIVELQDSLGPDDVDSVWSKVRDKLRDAETQLPPGTTEPELEQIEIRAYALLIGLSWGQDDPPNYAILQRQTQALEDILRSLPGTESVDIFGAPDEEIAVEIAPQQLAALGLTTQQIAQQIQQSDSKGTAGQLRGSNDILLEVAGELDSLEQIRQIPLRSNAVSDRPGQFAQLGDIAQVRKGIVEPPSALAQVGDRAAVVVGVYVESGYRLDRWSVAAHQALDEFQAQLSGNLDLSILQEQNNYVSERLDQLFSSLIQGAVLLFLVTIFMMGLQASLIIQVTLLICVLVVFGLMQLLGVPLHQMSVMGLIVSLGMLIDNAIIVVDDMQIRLQTGQRHSTAIRDSIGYLASPLMAGTLTTVYSFMPIALLTGNIGEFISTLGVNVILAISASLVIALTLTPVLMAHLHSGWKHWSITRSLGRWGSQGFSNDVMAHWYSNSVNWALARPLLTIVLSLLLPLSGFLAVTTLDLQFFPPAERDKMEIQLELPPAQSLAQTQTLVNTVREQLLQHPEIQDLHWFIGESSPRIYYNQVDSRAGEANYASGILQLSGVVSNDWIRETQEELDAAFPGARILLRWFEQGPPFSAPIELRIYGPDLDVLQTLGDQARLLLTQLPDVTHTRALLGESLPQLSVQVDEAAARSRGLSQAEIAQQLNATLEGVTGGSVLEGNEELPVRVRLSNADRSNFNQIASLNLLVANPASRNPLNTTPLNALGRLTLEPKRSAITRYEGIRVNTVQGFIQAGALPPNILAEFRQLLDESLDIPAGYRIAFGGEAEERGAAVDGLLASVSILVVLMVTTLVLSLGSFRLAAVVWLIAILAVGLGFLSEWICGFPMGFNPMIGIIGLIGVAVNDSITVLTALKSDPMANQGNVQAIRKVVLHSTRHVLTTTVTTVVGFTPLILGGGAFWPPLAVAIAGGVTGATFLALYFVPVVFLLLMRRNKPNNRVSKIQRTTKPTGVVVYH